MSPATETRQQTIPQLRSVDRAKRTVEIVASDFSLDSYGTRIDPAGWDLAQFKKNPVICLQHDSYGHSASSGLPIANAIPETVRVEGGKLVMTIRFPEEGKFPLADQVFNLVADGFLRGVSVGFDPSEWEDVEEEDGGYKKMVRIFRRQRLMETSLVTIPSNDNATVVQRARQLNREDKLDEYRRMTEEVERMAKEAAGDRQPPAGAEPADDEHKDEGEDRSALTVTIDLQNVGAVRKALSDVEALRGGLEAAAVEFVQRCIVYYEKKQPANRASTKVLKKFYKDILKEEIPSDEVKAWERMGEALEASHEVEEAKPEPDAETAKEAVDAAAQDVQQAVEAATADAKPADEPATPEPAPEAPQEETTPQPTPVPAAEAPQPERKASVRITLSALRALPTVLGKQVADEAAEALRQSMPVKDLDGYLDERGRKLLQSLIQHS